jgi:hypothetical protein
MDEKLKNMLQLYIERKLEILDFLNRQTDLDSYTVITRANELSDIESKIEVLEALNK